MQHHFGDNLILGTLTSSYFLITFRYFVENK